MGAPAEESPNSEAVHGITVEITDEAYEALQEMATTKGVSLEEALKLALASQRLLAREVAAGSTILIEKPDRSLRELVVA